MNYQISLARLGMAPLGGLVAWGLAHGALLAAYGAWLFGVDARILWMAHPLMSAWLALTAPIGMMLPILWVVRWVPPVKGRFRVRDSYACLWPAVCQVYLSCAAAGFVVIKIGLSPGRQDWLACVGVLVVVAWLVARQAKRFWMWLQDDELGDHRILNSTNASMQHDIQ